jgi:hypothetical protein
LEGDIVQFNSTGDIHFLRSVVSGSSTVYTEFLKAFEERCK